MIASRSHDWAVLDHAFDASGSSYGHGETSSGCRDRLSRRCVDATGDEIAALLALRTIVVFVVARVVVAVAKVVQCDEVKDATNRDRCDILNKRFYL